MKITTAMTKAILENENGVYSVSTHDAMLTISEILDELIIPMLLASGYSEDVIIKAMRDIER